MRFSLALTAAALSCLSAEVAGFAPPSAALVVDKSANRRHSHNRVVRQPLHHRSTSSSLLQAGLINTDENAPRDMEALTTWAQAAGVGMADGVQLTTQDGQDFSVMTTQPIANGNPILFVPRDVLFSSHKAKQELQSIGNLDAALDYLTRLGATPNILAKLCLILRILVEYERGDASPWYAWLNSLPRLFFNAVSMTDFCYECLPPLAFSLSRAERVKFDNFYEVVQKLDLDFLSPETRQNKDLLKWAFNVVQTRAVGPDGGEKHVIPMADMVSLSVCMVWVSGVTRKFTSHIHLYILFSSITVPRRKPSLIWMPTAIVWSVPPATFRRDRPFAYPMGRRGIRRRSLRRMDFWTNRRRPPFANS